MKDEGIWYCYQAVVDDLFHNAQRPGRVGSPGQKPPGRVGSRVKNPDPVPSVLRTAPDLQMWDAVFDTYAVFPFSWTFRRLAMPSVGVQRRTAMQEECAEEM